MIGFAQQHFPSTRHPNLTFIRMDALHLTFSEEFDIVFSNATLHWLSDHRPVLEGIKRCLVKGGRVVLQMGGKGNADQIFNAPGVMLDNPRWRNYFDNFSFSYGFFDTTQYRQLLVDAGLVPVRVELIPMDMAYPGREDFGGWIRTTWLPWLSRLPESEKQVFIEGLIDEYLVTYPADTEEVIHTGMIRLEVEAKKGV